MIVLSLNVKGLTNPNKAMALKSWIFSTHPKVDIICLQEVKAHPDLLEERLKAIAPDFLWLYTVHQRGAGGAAIGLAPPMSSKIESTLVDESD